MEKLSRRFKMNKKPAERCINCVNFLKHYDKCSCDYEYFKNIKILTAFLYVSMLFECKHFEDIRLLND